MPPPEPPALACAGLVHVYQVAGTDVAALRGVDLVVGRGQRVALLGPSGSGKSTLLTVVAGIMRPSAGRVEVFGSDLVRASPRALRRIRAEHLGLMLQGASTNLLLFADARSNIDYAVHGTRRGSTDIGHEVLRVAGILGAGRPVGSMSPADQQVVALAVAMATSPPLLLVDEPTSRLDDRARDRLLDLLVTTSAQQGTAVLAVTHDEAVARRMDRMIHLRDGRIAEEANAAGRYAVIGADGSVQLPAAALRGPWAPGALVTITVDGTDHIRLDPAGGPAG